MNTLKIKIQLDPISDGVGWDKEEKVNSEKRAVIVGTNGIYRLVEREEVIDILDKLQGIGVSDYLGKTKYVLVFNGDKILEVDSNRYIVGSVMVVKDTGEKVDLVDLDEIDTILKEFDSRLITLCSNGTRFSAYAID